MGKLAFAGLLQGLGKGIEGLGKSIEERRAAALEAARKEAAEARASASRQAERAEDRAWKVEDNATEQTQAIERIDKTATVAERAQKAGFAQQSTEAEKDRNFKAASEKRQMGHDANMKRLSARLASAQTADEIRLRNSLESGQVLDTYTTEDGKLAIVYKGGRREITDDPGKRETSAPAVDALGNPIAPPAKSGPKVDYSTYTETIGLINAENPGADREARRRMAFERAQKYGLPIPPREVKHAKAQGWTK